MKSKKQKKQNNKKGSEKFRLEVIHLNAIEVNITGEASLVSLDITNLIENDLRFNLFQVLYQQWNLVELSLRVDPLLTQGYSMPPLYAYLSYRGTDAGITADTVVTTGRRAATPFKGSTLKYRSNGRQNDFNYWFDTLDTTLPSLCFYLATPKTVSIGTSNVHAVVVASVYFKVRYPTLLGTNAKLVQEIKSLRKNKEEESFIIEEEEEEEIKEQKKILPYDEKKKKKK